MSSPKRKGKSCLALFNGLLMCLKHRLQLETLDANYVGTLTPSPPD